MTCQYCFHPHGRPCALPLVPTNQALREGCSLPTLYEWTTLTTYLGGTGVAGGAMKETGTEHWTTPNEGATNTSGFTALPGGNRLSNATFEVLLSNCYFWSSTQGYQSNAYGRNLNNVATIVNRYEYAMNRGFSVRCLKD